jgi:CubicO group peptidase (beta-lactamase class C family)
LLLDTFAGSFQAAGVAVAAACVDVSRVVTTVSPAETPPRGRFEIGSVTKTMTATLLALLAQGGTLRLGDEIGRWLSAGRNDGITLRQLATHTSGLPALCPGLELRRAGRSNPYAALTAEAAEEGLRQAGAGAGAGWRYSNFGYQLLGLVLERASGQHYHALAAERLLGPLAMTSTGAGRHGGGTVLPGHAKGHEVPHWDAPLPGHGGIESTAGDLARYAGSVLRPPPGPLGAAITLTQSPQVPIRTAASRHSAGWCTTAACAVTTGRPAGSARRC